ncbi:MAG: hypothetical protein ACI3U0_02680 [Oscillospiraceae bacterium]
MSETYPVLINGEKKGTLTVSREGLTTRFDAKCEDPGTLVRLSVYGGGREGYLGVMTPENGALTLHRKLTRAALAAFPAEIEFAAESGRKTAAPEQKPESERPQEKKPETAAPVQAAAVPGAAPKPRERTGDVLWRDAGDGSLFTVYKNQPYRAIPMAAWGLPTERMVEKRTINGVEYAIFALKDGKIV